ncbi:MAG: homoserine kinase [Candidatus Hodarchaeaceae archaeon]|nr:homoserine kinase [Candidatus Hodarchaeaceae archaeon]
MSKMVKVSAPATIANLGPGFDVFGLALSHPFDVVEAEKSEGGVEILEVQGVGAQGISKDSGKNSAGIAASEALRLIGAAGGVKLKIQKGVKPGGGIGSSSASAVAGAGAVNELFGGKLSAEQLIEAAARAEEKIAGTIHYDNVTPALVGGFTIVTSTKPLQFFRLDPPPMKVVVAQPALELPTALGRKVLPQEVMLKDAVANVAKASTMVAALNAGDLKLFGKCMVDSIAELARAPLIPGFFDVKWAALEAGALGAAMAGSGPSVFAILEPDGDAEAVAGAMKEAFERAGLGCETIITPPGKGFQVLRRG